MDEEQKRREAHPVWVVYNTQRTACLNLKYYGHMLRRLERQSRAIDFVIAFVAPTSAIASLPLWTTPMGREIWYWVPSIATILIVMKTALKSSTRIKDLEKRVTAYQGLLFDLRKVADKIRTEQKYSATMQKQYEIAIERYAAVMKLPPIDDNKKLKTKLQAEVNAEMPASNFFIPKE